MMKYFSVASLVVEVPKKILIALCIALTRTKEHSCPLVF